MENDSKKIQQFLSSVWWIVLLRGVAVLVLGLLLVFNPGSTLITIMIFLGAYWFVDGIFTIINSLKGGKTMEGWGWGIFSGVLGIIAGLVVFAHPLATAIFTQVFLIYFLAFMAITNGFSSIVNGIKLRKEIKNEWTIILGGLLTIIFGILLLVKPLVGSVLLLWLLGIIAIVGGIAIISLSFKVKNIAKAST